MTNSSPQDPQNPIPERRRKPAAGVTFDEMIAIIVAFSTIGAILFWSLGGKRGRIARNLGLGGQSSSLFTNNNVNAGNAGTRLFKVNSDTGNTDTRRIEVNSDANLGRIENGEDRPTVIKSSPKEKSLIVSTPSQSSSTFPRTPDRASRLAPLAGVAVLPGLKNRTQEKVEVEIDRQNPVGKPSQVDVPDNPAQSPSTPVQGTAPERPDAKTSPQAAAPDQAEVPEDITKNYWAYPFVKQMSDKNLVADYNEDQKFEPNKLITRAGMATLISQAFDNKPENENIKKFEDVSNNNELAVDIDQAVRMGFMQGYSDNEFRPLENIPRYQVLVSLATGLGLKPSRDADQILQQFGDASDMPDWAKQQVAAAAESGLIVNNPDIPSGSLDPNKSATRGEVAAMIHQALVKTGKLESIESEYIVKSQ